MPEKALPTTIGPIQLWEELIKHPDFRKQRELLTPFLGNPMWWLLSVRKVGGSNRYAVDPNTSSIWQDPRLAHWACRKALLQKLSQKRRSGISYHVDCVEHGLRTHCIPLIQNRTHHHALVLTHLHNMPQQKGALHLLESNLKSLIAFIRQGAELSQIKQTLRPRMVALSTVHTIHRLINTTVNLDELYKKLANLTAQVLRAKECSILVHEKSRKNHVLIERGKAPFAKASRSGRRRIKVGEGLEGRVFSTAKHVLRKQIISVPLIDEDVFGVITLRKKKDSKTFDIYDKEVLMTLAEEATVAIQNAALYEEQKKVTLETIHSLAAILGTRFAPQRKFKPKTLLAITIAMAEELRLNENDREAVHYATLLKDANKIGLPDHILKKTARLSGDDYQILREHPVQGAKMIQSFNSLKPVAPILLSSHENYDGSGYPYGLKGKAIPIGSRLLAVVNAFDALTGGRPYKQGIAIEGALAELSRNRGTQFDPHVVDVFLKVIAKAKIARLLKKDLANHAHAQSK